MSALSKTVKIREQYRKEHKLPPAVNPFERHSRAVDDQRYRLLDPAHISELISLFHKQHVKIAFDMRYDAALASPIQFERGDWKLTEEAKEWHSEVYERWCRDKEARCKQIGFAIGSCRPHPIYGYEPTIIDPEKVDIYFWGEPDGTPHIRVFERCTDFVMSGVLNPSAVVHSPLGAISGLDERYEQREIHNIEVFWEMQPDARGQIRSVIQLLSEDLIFSEHLLSLTMEANEARVRIPLITERVPDKLDRDSISATPSAMAFLGDGNTPSQRDHMAERRTVAEERKRELMTDLLRIQNSEERSKWDNMIRYIDQARRRNPENAYYQQIDLPAQRKLVTPHLPEAPNLLMEFRTARFELILNAFGLSLSMLSNASSSSMMRQKTGQEGKGGTGNNSNALKMFMNSQKALRHRLQTDIKKIYTRLNLKLLYDQSVAKMREEAWSDYKSYRMKEIAEYKKQKQSDQNSNKRQKLTHQDGGNMPYLSLGGGGQTEEGAEDEEYNVDWEYDEFQSRFRPNKNTLQDKIDIKITIPGIPDDDNLFTWYNMGILKYPVLTSMLAARHGLQESDFNDKPEVTVKEVNGIIPPEPKSNSSSK